MPATLDPALHADFLPDPNTLLTYSRQGTIGVVVIQAPLIRERQAAALRSTLVDCVRECSGRLVVETSENHGMTAAWIRVLGELSDLCRQFGGQLALAGAGEFQVQALRQTRLAQDVLLGATREECVRALQNPQNRSSPRTTRGWRKVLARLLDRPAKRAA